MNEQISTPQHDPAEPIEQSNTRFSIIWLLPIVAAIIGGWVLYQNIMASGIKIRIDFENAEGIEIGKTKIIYKGIDIGLVKDIRITEDMRQVKVIAEIRREAENGLRDKSRFWLVKPKISFTGITGLDTLVTGNYIATKPGKGEPKYHFTALSSPPSVDKSISGLHIRLQASKLGSVDRGSLVYYRQIPVGRVEDYRLAKDMEKVVIYVHIDEEYDHLVNSTTRFWNTSGVSFNVDLSGLSVDMGSLATLVSGGIAFTSNGHSVAELSRNGDAFTLYDDFENAQVGIPIKLNISQLDDFAEGRYDLKYNGVNVGKLTKTRGFEQSNIESLDAVVDPDAENLLREGTQFWLVKPQLSLTGISNLKSFLQGNYIEIQPGSGEPTRTFPVNQRPSFLASKDKGLHLVLNTDELGALEVGSPVLYKKMQVGSVLGYKLADNGQYIKVDISVDDKFSHLVSKRSLFWNSSGIEVDAGLSGLAVKTGTLKSIFAGGVEFKTPYLSKRKSITLKSGHAFQLFQDKKAIAKGNLKQVSVGQAKHVRLQTNDLGSLAEGSPVYYQKIPVGQVEGFELADDDHSIWLDIRIEGRYRRLLKSNSRFYRNSGFSLQGGLSGIKLKTASVKALLQGGVSFYNPPEKRRLAKPGQTFSLFEDDDAAKHEGMLIKIFFDLAEGLAEGSPIKYRGITVGKVQSVELTELADKIAVNALLFSSAAKFARTGSQFWLVSPQLSLTRTAHLDTLIGGKYIAIYPGKGANSTRFNGHLKEPLKQHQLPGLNLVLLTTRLNSLKPGDPVYYRQFPVGSITGYDLSKRATSVEVFINIEPHYVPLVRENSQFWSVSGVNLDLGLFQGFQIHTDSFESLLSGGVAFATPDNDQMGGNPYPGTKFILHEDPQKEWLTWLPKIRLDE